MLFEWKTESCSGLGEGVTQCIQTLQKIRPFYASSGGGQRGFMEKALEMRKSRSFVKETTLKEFDSNSNTFKEPDDKEPLIISKVCRIF